MPKASATLSSSSPTPPIPATYEAAMSELEQLVQRLESGELPLDELMGGYQRGAALLQHCRDKLQAVEAQIKGVDEGTLKPWAPQ
ncbi:MAG: exodeoxyribonuclease VII small subunit [Burkholderiales bacterium PBB4]|nr:MAG: exodeoxyribonuclease VII small subunit [Burkholderiales bacterium PBB4]